MKLEDHYSVTQFEKLLSTAEVQDLAGVDYNFLEVLKSRYDFHGMQTPFTPAEAVLLQKLADL